MESAKQIKELNKYCKKTISGKHLFVEFKRRGQNNESLETYTRCLACGVFKDE